MSQFLRRPAGDPTRATASLGPARHPVALAALGIALVATFLFVLGPGASVLAEVEGLLPPAVLGGSASGQETIWARLPIQAPECNCHTPPLAQVYSTLEDEHLSNGLTDEGSVGSWQYMSLTFDSRQVSRQHILDLIATDHGVILPGRPASLPTATATGHVTGSGA